MGVRIGPDQTVGWIFSYSGHNVVVHCQPVSTTEYDAWAKNSLEIEKGIKTASVVDNHALVVKQIRAVEGIDKPDGEGGWKPITSVGPLESEYLREWHPALLTKVAGKLFTPFDATDEEVKPEDGGVPLDESEKSVIP